MAEFYDYKKDVFIARLRVFFGEDAEIQGDDRRRVRVRWRHYIDDDNVLIVTDRVYHFGRMGVYALVLNSSVVLFLKNWQITKVKNFEFKENRYAIKLNRNYFKPYQLSFHFNDYETLEKTLTFDDLVTLAKNQDGEQLWWRLGHYTQTFLNRQTNNY